MARRLDCKDLLDRQRTVVSETQLLASHDVTPTIIMTVNEFFAKLDPSSVMLVEPFIAKLDFFILTISAVSVEKAIVWVSDRCSIVIETCLDPLTLCCTLHRTEESDCHDVYSHAVKPILAEIVLLPPAVLNSDPKMVTNTCPMAGEFFAFVDEMEGKSVLKSPESVERAVAIVMTASRVPLALAVTMPCTCVSEIHIVVSQEVIPTFKICVES